MFCLGVVAEGGARGTGQWQAGWSPGVRAVSRQASDVCEPQHSVLHLLSKLTQEPFLWDPLLWVELCPPKDTLKP